MERKAMSSSDGPNSLAPANKLATGSSAMTRDELVKKLSANPRFRLLPPSGEGS